MKLSECKLGEIIVAKDNPRKIGHIVGLTYSYPWRIMATVDAKRYSDGTTETCEIIPLVKFVGDELPVGIHPGNIEKLK